MAGGRDLRPRSPRWLNGLIWSSGLGATGCFLWRMMVDASAPMVMPPGLNTFLLRLLGCVLLPLPMAITALGRAVRRVVG